MAELRCFAASLHAHLEYPKNLISAERYQYALAGYSRRLEETRSDLFASDDRVDVAIHQRLIQDGDYETTSCKSFQSLKQTLGGSDTYPVDPQCRFIFVNAAHSRAPLNVTMEMLTYTLTYHQVMPEFLDFILPFGRQLYPRDFHFGGFRHLTRIGAGESVTPLTELGRSGQNLQLAYSLKAVEPSKGNRDWPWAIRQSSVHHSFDTTRTHGHATWTCIKANNIMKNRIMLATKDNWTAPVRAREDFDHAFGSTLRVHLIFCDWSAENWRWYINFLEKKFQDLTRNAIVADLDTQYQVQGPSTSPTSPDMPPPSRRETLKRALTTASRPFQRNKPAPQDSPVALQDVFPEHSTLGGTGDFSFDKLQDAQDIEDKANEAQLVLTVNLRVLRALKSHYAAIGSRSDCPEPLARTFEEQLPFFERRLLGIIDDIEMQQSRLDSLLRLIVDRKELLYGILNYRNMKATQMLALRAQRSADEMAQLTEDMRKIAQKTEQETVSMRIITLVTLFYLPGTFISTLMSTDIIRFTTSSAGISTGDFSRPALRLFMAITIPLMFATFLTWLIVYKWVEHRKALQRLNERLQEQMSRKFEFVHNSLA